MALIDVLATLRPKQWTKNAFVLVGPLFGHRWAGDDLLHAALALIAFCLASGASPLPEPGPAASWSLTVLGTVAATVTAAAIRDAVLQARRRPAA